MFRTPARVVIALALLVGTSGAPALAEAEEPQEPLPQALPFLAGQEPGCATATAEARPLLAELEVRSTSPAAVCTGCSVHNCYFQTVGTLCLVNGRRGRCTDNPHICPEVKEVSCTCEVP